MSSKLIKATADYVKSTLTGESSGHDWWHVYRVWQMSKKLAKSEAEADLLVIELAALLHDIADWKFNNGTNEVGIEKAKILLKDFGVSEEIIENVCHIIDNVSFKGAKVKNYIATIEGKIVQDADRLDAIGAIGIARAFAYGGGMGREIYNPDIKPRMHASFEEYKNSKGTSINHFYEKLLLLKNMLNTKTAKKIAEKRHKFMKDYLVQFFKEWDGKI